MGKLVSEGMRQALQKFHDETASFARATGRDYHLVLVPTSPDEDIVISLGGKPQELGGMDALEAIQVALARREIAIQNFIAD